MSDPVLDVDVLTLRGIIAAAEERGRRRGVEEAAKCPDCGGELESFCSSEKCRNTAIKAWSLAPRDSGKERP